MADDTMPEKKLINCVSVNAAKMPTEKTLPADLSDSFRDKCRMQKNSSPLMEQQNQSGAISCGTQASMNVTTTTITTPQINNASLSSNAATTNANTPSQQQSAASATGVNKVTTKKATTTPQKLSAADYCFGKTIGEGSYSTVYLAKNIHSSKEFAIKVVEKALIIRMNMHKNVTREREVMHLLTNVPGFVNLSCTFQDPTYLYFVMTYAKNGDLLPHINKVGSFDLNCTRYYAAELVLALENMHSRGLIHRDLKPENILLDEKMHTLIADFGSAKNLATSEPPPATVNRPTTTTTSTTTTTGRRRNSFVGTAQYVSPEVVQGQLATTASDLWALGCIVYQMIAGLPPFRAPNEYLIFQKILKLEMSFPDGFNAEAADLVKSLLQINPMERLGAQDPDYRYISIRALPFFKSICWETLRSETPPPIYPYLPGVQDDDEVTCSQFGIMYNLEPGFGVRQQTQLLGRELGTSNNENDNKIETQQNGGGLNLTNNKNDDFEQRMKVQRDTNPWDKFAQGQLILKHGYVNKRKGLFSRKRMLLLTTGPCLIYIDPVRMVKKGEITWTVELRVEAKNFKVFFVHTPTRTYYLEDPEGFALVWCQAIKELWTEYYG